MARIFEEPIDCKRILREISILKAIRGMPGVVQLIEIVPPSDPVTFDCVYLVLEYCQSDLKKLLRQNRYLSLNQVRRIMTNLLEALSLLHSSHLVHRDLKPANVLLNDDMTIKICDFGLSRAVFDLQNASKNILK